MTGNVLGKRRFRVPVRASLTGIRNIRNSTDDVVCDGRDNERQIHANLLTT